MFCAVENYHLFKLFLEARDSKNDTPKMWVRPSPLIWDKKRTTSPFRGLDYSPSTELILFAAKAPRERKLTEPSRELLSFSPIDSRARVHPFEKPQELLRFLIKQSTFQSHMVLDPFAGSASTLIAARSLGRKSLGFELDEERFLGAQQRLLESEPKIS